MHSDTQNHLDGWGGQIRPFGLMPWGTLGQCKSLGIAHRRLQMMLGSQPDALKSVETMNK